MIIGVFDSGRGGELIAERLRHHLPEHTYLVVNDQKNVPYGSRSSEEIIELTDAAIQPLLADSDIIVIACNTATMAGINTLRQRYPGTLFVGTEPMIKPAATITKSGRITVLATPLTMRSQRYKALRDTHGHQLKIDEPYTQHWASHIEYQQLDQISFEELDASSNNGSDVIILACTHYLALQDIISERYPRAHILEPSKAIARQIDRLVVSLQPS